jgi:hypothetical protein
VTHEKILRSTTLRTAVVSRVSTTQLLHTEGQEWSYPPAVSVSPHSLTITLETLRVVTEPGSLPGTTLDTVGTVSTLAESTTLASSARQATAFTVLMDGVDDPVNTRVVTDLLMCGVDHDDLVVLHGCVLVDPVRVQHTKVGVPPSGFFFCNILEVSFELQMVNTLMLGLTEDHTTVILTLTSTTTDTGTDDNVPLLGLVSQPVGLFGTCRTVARQDVRSLTVLPCSDTHQES